MATVDARADARRADGSPIDPRCDPDATAASVAMAAQAERTATADAAAAATAAADDDAAHLATTVVYTTTTTVQHATADEHEQWLGALEDVALNQSHSFV